MQTIDHFDISTSVVCDPEDCSQYISNTNQYLKILQQNIRSLNCNYSELLVLLRRLSLSCDIILLSECWLSNVINLPSLQGYNSHRTNDNYNQNDGLVVYTANTLQCIVEEPFLLDANCLTIKIKQDTVLIAIYRPPSFKSLDNFLNSLHSLLESLSNFKNIVIAGDVNIDLLKNNRDTSAYFDSVSFHGLLSANHYATREDACLDHVMLKTKLNAYTFTLNTTITDHKSVLLCIKDNFINTHKIEKVKSVLKINSESLITACENYNFEEIYKETNLNVAMNKYITIIQQLISNNSLRKIIPRSKYIIKPWITSGVLRCIRTRDRMHKKIKLNTNDDILKITYKRYRNFCNNLLKKLKKQYEKEQLVKSKNNPKHLWTSIKTITNTNKLNHPPLELLKTDPNPITAINTANTYFSHIGKELAERIPTHLPSFENVSKPPLNSFVLLPTDSEEVKAEILSLKSDCSPGWDQISAKILKTIYKPLTPVLTHIINKSFESGTFPDALKKAVVIPIFKAGNRESVNNYRPIAILTTLSKIFERLINKRLTVYLENFNLLSNSQYGFRSGRSTESAVLDLVNFVAEKLDNKFKCLTIFLDLAKAFDTVSVPRLVQKLENLGIRGIPLQLLSSYLSNRKQCLKVGDLIGDELPVNYGVPQGSILGPTLFLCYINDMCSLNIENCRISAYADDTALTFHSECWHDLLHIAQNGFNTISHWLSSNYLTLNEDKTKYIVFSIHNRQDVLNLSSCIYAHKCNFPPNPNCNCNKINQTKHLKYLGVEVDANLTFENHLLALSQKIRKLTYIFKYLREVADKSTMRMVYESLVQSIIRYCITTWGGANQSKMIVVERAQRMILKVSLSKPRLFPTTQLYMESQSLTVRQLYIMNTIIYNHSNTSHTSQHRVAGTRRNYIIRETTKVKTSFAQRFYSFRGPLLSNKFYKIENIKNCSKIECKTKLKKWLIGQSYSETENLLKLIV